MKKVRSFFLLQLIVILTFIAKADAKNVILFIMEQNAYNALGGSNGTVHNVMNSIEEKDGKMCVLVPWTLPTGNNYVMCNPLFTYLQNQYTTYQNNGHHLEGAVMIGNVPVPMLTSAALPVVPGLPMDQVYMDLIDNRTGSGYVESPYKKAGAFEYTDTYSAGGDHAYEIWVSRINAEYLIEGIRGDIGTVYDPNQVYQMYFDRCLMRLNYPANVPNRGFVMGGVQESWYPNLHDVIGSDMAKLNMGMLAEFTGLHNTAFNWASQLLAGPRGCVTYGAFDNSLFSASGPNRRFSRYSTLPVVYNRNRLTTPVTKSVSSADTLGWEWSGLYNHSFPVGSNFFDRTANGFPLQGVFGYGTFGPYWGNSFIITGSGYNNSYHYWTDQTNPYNYACNGRSAEWRYIVPATTNYEIYLYYTAPISPNVNTINCNAVQVDIVQTTVDASGLPASIDSKRTITVDQQRHTNYSSSNNQFEVLVSSLSLTAGHMVIVRLDANHGCNHRHIADAVQFRRLDNMSSAYIDDVQPSIPDSYNNSSGIFTTQGFFTNADVDRHYENLCYEPGGGGKTKTQFYCMNACNINFFTQWRSGPIDKNVGCLYALGHNGLICMGAASEDDASITKDTFFTSLEMGKNFGEAYLAQSNKNFFSNSYCVDYALLGLGALRSDAYIQYGSVMMSYESYTTQNHSVVTDKPVYIQNVTVNQNGGLSITSSNIASSPECSFSEIKIRPSTQFSPTSGHEVHFVVN